MITIRIRLNGNKQVEFARTAARIIGCSARISGPRLVTIEAPSKREARRVVRLARRAA